MVVQDNPARAAPRGSSTKVAGLLFYRAREGELVLVHTEVADEFEGQRIESRLVAGALDDICARGLRMQPMCPFGVRRAPPGVRGARWADCDRLDIGRYGGDALRGSRERARRALAEEGAH